jgi:hypothetical protein
MAGCDGGTEKKKTMATVAKEASENKMLHISRTRQQGG